MGEVIFTGGGDEAHDKSVRRRARIFAADGKVGHSKGLPPVRKLLDGVYTTNLSSPPAEVVARNAWEILGRMFPGSVISARSAMAAGVLKQPDGRSVVFLTGPYRRNVDLPGLDVRIAEGPGALPGDVDFMGLRLASPARHCLENLMPSRARSGLARAAGRLEVEEFLARKLLAAGEEALVELRDAACSISGDMGASSQYRELDAVVGALTRRRDAGELLSPKARAVALDEQVDEKCLARLREYFLFLAGADVPRRPGPVPGGAASVNTAFMEAYFSNYIEGTQFLIGEAERIVFDGVLPTARPKDGHDVLATFRQLSDFGTLANTPKDADGFVAALQARHLELMGARPEVRPGRFKESANRAGMTVFTHPDLVRGTLKAGFDMLRDIERPFARAAFVHYLVSEVHPFDDGNGRLSRIMMAAELESGGLSRAVIPTIYRSDYIEGQRALTRNGDAAANFRMLDEAQRITSKIAEDDRDKCISKWASTNAFLEREAAAVLVDPDPTMEIEWRDGVPAPADYWRFESALGGRW